MIHYLKIQEEYFKAKINGLKPWEIRDNTDRNFKVGDDVIYYPIDRNGNKLSGSAHTKITYVCGGDKVPSGQVIYTEQLRGYAIGFSCGGDIDISA